MLRRRHVVKAGAALAVSGALGACAAPEGMREASRPEGPLGDFRLGFAIVTAEDPAVGPLSRTATVEEWEEVLTAALKRELGGYEGERLYHIGISVDGYTLALPGIPVVASPKSVLGIGVTVWDDAKGEKINPEPRRMAVFESFGGDTLLGSGLTRSKREQMEDLAANAARKVHLWLRENAAWFGGDASEAGAGEAAAEGESGA
ncbi:MAG: hypothetical protein D6811_09565 [Alphaproteobacteria bacterium]|nr:MAG: hypothetical protein D6811_09565 [Alphaproteobacteria bacterium]